MKVTIEENKEYNPLYKFIMGNLYTANSQAIVLCTTTANKLIGVAIYGDKIGFYSDTWVSENFSEFHGKITLDLE